MKKTKILCLISIFLVCAMVLTVFSPAIASTKGTEAKAMDLRTDLTPLKETDRAGYYVFVGSRLLQSFPTTVIQTQYGQEAVIAYPPEYAGAYLEPKTFTLHIILTKDATIATINNYQSIMGGDKDIVYEYADFPLSRLYDVQRTLDAVMLKFGIQTVGVNDSGNRVELSLLDNSQQQAIIDLLKAKFHDFDVRCLSFNDPVHIQLTDSDTASNALAGSKTKYSDGSYATIGFNAYRHATGQAGVITAGHFATSGTTIYNKMGTTIGSETVRQQGTQDGADGKIDAAFVPFPTSITYSYRLSGTAYTYPQSCITHYFTGDSYIFQNQPTSKIGAYTGVTVGDEYNCVLLVTDSLTLDGITYSDQIHISNQQFQGDSGGPVFQTISNSPGNFNILMGIATIGESNAHGWVSKVWNINSAFGVTPFYGT